MDQVGAALMKEHLAEHDRLVLLTMTPEEAAPVGEEPAPAAYTQRQICTAWECTAPAEWECQGTPGNMWIGWYCHEHKEQLLLGRYKHQATPDHPTGVVYRRL